MSEQHHYTPGFFVAHHSLCFYDSSIDRNPHSHKGDNGKVAIIGGSRHQHGAPLFSALAVEASGVDLIYVMNPLSHREVAMEQSLNFQVHPFTSDDLLQKDVNPVLEFLATMDCAVIGPGIARTKKSIDATLKIVSEASCPLVCDATALQPDTLKLVGGRSCVFTPHLGELERMQMEEKNLPSILKGTSMTMIVKGVADHIYADGRKEDVSGGNAGLTVGGTGDVLAGLIAGLIAQQVPAFDACRMASTVIKRAGTALFHEYGYAYTSKHVIAQIPHLLATMTSE